MAIRAFLCTWSETPVPGGVSIENPIDVALANTSLSAPVVGLNYYARLSQAHRPDKLYMLKVMRGNIAEAEWTSISNIAGVRAIPPGAFDKTIASINNPTKNKIYTALDGLGISRTLFDSAATVGGFLRNLTAELDTGAVGFGPWELLAGEWA